MDNSYYTTEAKAALAELIHRSKKRGETHAIASALRVIANDIDDPEIDNEIIFITDLINQFEETEFRSRKAKVIGDVDMGEIDIQVEGCHKNVTVRIRLVENIPTVLIWANYNEDAPSHTIPLMCDPNVT